MVTLPARSATFLNLATTREALITSTATISTRTDSAVIASSKWADPEIFIEPAEPGVGIASTTTEYALSDSRYTAPTTGWSTLYPEREDGQYIWTRITVTYTDGTEEIVGLTCSTGDPGPAGPATGLILKYAYGHSYLEPPKGGLYWALERRLMYRDGKISGLPPQAWTRVDRPRPSTGEWYLWVKWSTDGGKTYCQPKLMSGEGTKSIRIVPSGKDSYRMSSRGTVTEEQQLVFHVEMQNLSGVPTWSIPALHALDDYVQDSEYQVTMEDLDGNQAVEKDGLLTIVAEYVMLKVRVGCRTTQFMLDAYFPGSYSDSLPIVGQVPQYSPEYLGKFDEPPEETVSGEPLMIGDHYYDLSSGRGYEWKVDPADGKEKWMLITGDSEIYSIVAGHMLGDALMHPVNDDDNLTIANIWTDTIAFNNGFGRKFASTDFQLMENEETEEPGKIRSYGFTEDQFGKVPGVLIDALGKALFSMVRMMNVDITTYSEDGNQIILQTQFGQSSDHETDAVDDDFDYILGQQIIDAYLDYGRANNEVDDDGVQELYDVTYIPWGSGSYVQCVKVLDDSHWATLWLYGSPFEGNAEYSFGPVNFNYTLKVTGTDGENIFGKWRTEVRVTVTSSSGSKSTIIDVSTTGSYTRTFDGKAGDILDIYIYRQSWGYSGKVTMSLKPRGVSGDYLMWSHRLRVLDGLAIMNIFGVNSDIIICATANEYLSQLDNGYLYLPYSSSSGSVWSYLDNTAYYINQSNLRSFFSDVPTGNRLCSVQSWIQFDGSTDKRYPITMVERQTEYVYITYFDGGARKTYVLDLVHSSSRGFSDRIVQIHIQFLDLPVSLITATLVPSMVGSPEHGGLVVESDIGMSDRRYRNIYSRTVDTEAFNAHSANLEGLPKVTTGLVEGDLWDDNGTIRIYHP